MGGRMDIRGVYRFSKIIFLKEKEKLRCLLLRRKKKFVFSIFMMRLLHRKKKKALLITTGGYIFQCACARCIDQDGNR